MKIKQYRKSCRQEKGGEGGRGGGGGGGDLSPINELGEVQENRPPCNQRSEPTNHNHIQYVYLVLIVRESVCVKGGSEC